MTKWLLLGALLSSPAGCAPMPSTASPRGAPPRVLLTFHRTGGFVVQSGYHKLVLFEDGRLQYEGRRAFGNPEWDEVPIAPPAMARVRSSLERLSALSPDCCNCSNATDQSWVFMTFQVAGGTDVRKDRPLHGLLQDAALAVRRRERNRRRARDRAMGRTQGRR